MKVLLDACVPRLLRAFLLNHSVQTAQEMGWGLLKNGDLLREAEAKFEVFITSDKQLKYQQNLSTRKIAILQLPSNNWTILRPMGEKIANVVSTLRPGDYVEFID